MNRFKIVSNFSKYKECFIAQNSKLNLISKNDEKFLYEKHIYDSLSIKLFFEKYSVKNAKILDIGCGGGFPCVPIAIEYPDMKITGIDSIRKKINAVNEIKNSLKLENLSLICDRAENINDKYDIIVSRAVAKIDRLTEIAFPLLKKDGYLIFYKSKTTLEEIKTAKNVLNNYHAKVIDIIEYSLPLEEKFERNLVVIQKFDV